MAFSIFQFSLKISSWQTPRALANHYTHLSNAVGGDVEGGDPGPGVEPVLLTLGLGQGHHVGALHCPVKKQT